MSDLNSLIKDLSAIKMPAKTFREVLLVILKHLEDESSKPDAYFLRRGISASEWRKLRDAVLSRDNNRCQYCGRGPETGSLHCDHVLPLFKGGSNELSNLVTACKSCNSSKRAKTVEEWKGGQ